MKGTLKAAMRAVHAGEWLVLRRVRSHAVTQKIAAITAICQSRKAHALLLAAQRYAERFAHILKNLPAAERQVAINRLMEEQALENQNIEKAEEARLADDKGRALAPIKAQHRECAAALRRKQRDERVMLMARLRHTPRQLELRFSPRYRAKLFLGQKRTAPRGPELR